MNCSFIDEKEGVDTATVEKRGTQGYDLDPAVRDVEDIRSRFAGGNGTEDDPYRISNVTQLQDMNLDLGANYTLVNDIDATDTREWNEGKGFLPIASFDPLTWYFRGTKFTGSLDAKGYNITGLFIDRPDENFIGLFSCIDDVAAISNVGMLDNNIGGEIYVGGLVGRNDGGNVSNCHVSGSVNGSSYVGGLVGRHTGNMVSNYYARGRITGEHDVGGLVGWNSGTVGNSHYNIDSVLINGEHHVTIGGLFNEQFNDWLTSGLTLNITHYNSTLVASGTDYVISEVQGLKDILGFADDVGLRFRLGADIDLSTASGLYIPYFSAAEFNGSGHIITNLNIQQSFALSLGMFGFISNDTVIDSFGVVDINVMGSDNVGGLVGWNNGTVVNCYATGDVSGEWDVGGLVGWNRYGTVKDCHTAGSVRGLYDSGGIIGRNLRGKISNCYSTGNISGEANYVGGIVAINIDGTVENCSAIGNIGGGHNYIGGIVGSNNGWLLMRRKYIAIVSNCYAALNVNGSGCVSGLVGENNFGVVNNCFATGNVTGEDSVGGLVGLNHYGIIEDCYATGNIHGEEEVGGLVGYNAGEGTISNCYATGTVNGLDQIGGLIGHNKDSTVSNCYATGAVNGSDHVGGFVGYNENGIVFSSFWDMETSGTNASDEGTCGITIDMKMKRTYANVGWDFNSTWGIYEHLSYPYLLWEKRNEVNMEDSDNDLIPDIFDHFPFDPAASIDSDKDGAPDEWNPEMNRTNSTTGLHIDAFPFDPAASIDSDGDGMPDDWNLGTDRGDSTSDPPLELDPFPDDPENTIDDGSNSWILVTLGTSLMVIILFLIVLIVARKRQSVKSKKADEDKEDLGRIKPND